MEMESHSWGRKKAVRVAGVNMVKFITLPFFFLLYLTEAMMHIPLIADFLSNNVLSRL